MKTRNLEMTTMISTQSRFATLLGRTLFAFAALGAIPIHEARALPPLFAGDEAGRSDTYREGQRALADERWEEALQIFRSVADAKGADADAALYWTAWTEWKLARKGAALGTLRALAESYPKSSWLDDARALEVQIQGGGKQESGSPDDEELKIYALDGLMQVEPEQAVPILERFLAGNHSLKLKERALFVLAQSDSPRSRQVLLDLVRRGTPPELRLKAVEQLGVAGGREDLEALATIWKEATPEVKERVLQAWMIAGVEEPVFEVAKNEKDPELRRKAIETLGVMGATKELGLLYAAESDRSVRFKLLEAYGVAGDEQALLRAAKSETDLGLRRKAIESIGVFGGSNASKNLVELYETESDRDLKEKIIEALMIAGDSKPLIALFKKETDRELKKKILQQIAVMGDDETAELFADLLEEKP
jgi:HEAT repeat protein